MTNTFATRRRVIAASAAMPLAAGAPRPALPDPIYALIDAHRRAYSDLVALLAAQQAVDHALLRADAAARPTLQAKLDALCEAEGPLGRAEMRATDRLIHTIPDTLAGAAAALGYLRELFARDRYAPCEDDDYRALLLSIECAIRRETGLPAS